MPASLFRVACLYTVATHGLQLVDEDIVRVDDELEQAGPATRCNSTQVRCIAYGKPDCVPIPEDGTYGYGGRCEIPVGWNNFRGRQSDPEWTDGRPIVWSSERNPAGGLFTVWKFPLRFSEYALWDRRFGVDVPADLSSCQPSGCPIIFDFPGSGGDVYTQRVWTKWFQYQKKVGQKFILVTMAGSPDGVSPYSKELLGNVSSKQHWLLNKDASSQTSWNVLGWSSVTDPVDATADSCSKIEDSTCIVNATEAKNAYPCWFSTMMNNNDACHNVHGKMWPNKKCFSVSQANDWDYVRNVVAFVTDSRECRAGSGSSARSSWCGDPTRIYFTGQSMGGMSSWQFAVGEGKYAQTPSTRPAAVVACSAGGSRNNNATLAGQVPTLLLQGGRDPIAVPTPFAGYNRTFHPLVGKRGKYPGHDYDYDYDYEGAELHRLVREDPDLVRRAMEILNLSTPNLTDPFDPSRKAEQKQVVVVEADALSGGALLEEYANKQKHTLGCPDRYGKLTGISNSGYMWQTIPTTLRNVAGKEVNMTRDLVFFKPISESVSEAAVDSATMRCAYVPGHFPSDPTKIKYCQFDGQHTWPWNSYTTGYWYPGTDDGTTFHDFVWVDFLESGNLRRGSR